MSEIILNVYPILQVLTVLSEIHHKDFLPDNSFVFSEVRETFLSYLIAQNALTVTQVFGPKELISRLNWLTETYQHLFNKPIDLYEITPPNPKRFA